MPPKSIPSSPLPAEEALISSIRWLILDCGLFENHGELDVDLRSHIAAEARAKIVYER
jgi:hypothetical protein